MEVALVQISGVHAHVKCRRPVPAGIVGAQVRLEYLDPVWDGLQKTVVFYGAGVKDVITDESVVTIPAEVVAKPNIPLAIGVYGVDAQGAIVIPTLRADLGTVRVSTDPSGDTSTNPALPVWAQVQRILEEQIRLLTQARENGEFNGPQGTDGKDGADGAGITMIEIQEVS